MHTPLFDEYQKLDGKIVDFHGWMMPIHFSGIIDEHRTVREKVGIFDVSHMGSLIMKGENAGKQLQDLCTNDILSIDIGKSIYTHILNDDGNIIDDNIVFRTMTDEYMIMPNASMIDIISNWIQKHIDLDVLDLSNEYSVLAIQGPEAIGLLTNIFGEGVKDIPKFNFAFYRIDNGSSEREASGTSKGSDHHEIHIHPSPIGFPGFRSENMIMVSRTGYTGEDGVELIVRNEHIVSLWKKVLAAGEEYGIKPIGLGARDTLRLEMGYLLSGQDFNGTQSPLESNCAWVVKWDHDFIGKDHLVKQKEEKTYQRLAAVMLDGKAVARPGADVLAPVETEGSPPRRSEENIDSQLSEDNGYGYSIIGTVTSGNYSPTLEKAIALVRIDRKYAKAGTELIFKQGRRKFNGVVIRLPFINKGK
ncbi:MAG: glycine cleavage system aminomethyltransferase GcvT [Thermoplasmata archaeon]|nr:glycine cleavage system aminomethyltransferase GcvT [Thermoplasmata archaeon]